MTVKRTVLITGNTYPVKEQLKALGGRWDPEARGWHVSEDKALEARTLVTSAYRPRYHPGYSPKDTSIAEELHDTFMLYKDEDPDDAYWGDGW